MSKRPIFFAEPLRRIRWERRQRMISLWVSILFLLALAGLCGWLTYLVRAGFSTGDNGGNGVSSFRFQGSGLALAMAPLPATLRVAMQAGMWQGSFLAGLALMIVVVSVLAVRKVRADEAFYASLRREEEVFAPLREPGLPVPPADAQRILVACAAEARLIMQHVRRAGRTLSVEDYGDELQLAEGKLESVIRCVEALAQRTNAGGGR